MNPVIGAHLPTSHANHNNQASTSTSGNHNGGLFQSGQNSAGLSGNQNANASPLGLGVGNKEMSDHIIFNHKDGGVMEQNYGSQLQQQHKQIKCVNVNVKFSRLVLSLLIVQ